MIDMTEEKFVELLSTVVDETVKHRLQAEREKFWISPEDHFLDHQVLKTCRAEKVASARAANHRYIVKLRKREKMITTTAFRSTVVVTIALVADWICRQVGLDVGLSKFMTIFK